jgi:hypothetical protein
MTFLLDGPLMTTIERRRETTERMAKELIQHQALANEQDSERLLIAQGYSAIDVAILASEARMLAFQEIVAEEMSKS